MSILGTIKGIGQRANPTYATVTPIVIFLAGLYAIFIANDQWHMYVHVMGGVLWTGIDVFFGLVLGPVIGGLSEKEKADVFKRLTPKISFLLTPLAITTIFTGITLIMDRGAFPHSAPWLALFTAVNLIPAVFLIGYQFDAFDDWRWVTWQAIVTVGSLAWVGATIQNLQATTLPVEIALGIVTILSVEGFGVIMPGEVRVYKELTKETPDTNVISRIGMRNAKLGGVQGAFQICLIAVMVWIAHVS